MPRNKNPKVTVDRILDSATKLFFEKGYDATTIQDIVDDLGDLSKGAIYHHFKGKEDIVEAVGIRMFNDDELLRLICKLEESEDKNYSGLEKLQKLIIYCLTNWNQIKMIKAMPNILKNPRFLVLQLNQSVREISPVMTTLVEEGILDGSITTKYPSVISQAFLLLTNIWLNPLIFCEPKEVYERKIFLVKEMLDGVGFPVMNDEMIEAALSLGSIVEDIETFVK